MQNRQRDGLARRQQQLLARSAELRDTLAWQARALASPLALADRLRAGARWLQRHPAWPLAGLAWLLLRPPRRVLRWLPSLFGAWQLLRRVGLWLGRRPRSKP